MANRSYRAVFVFIILLASTAAAGSAQGPKGVGADIKAAPIDHAKPSKPGRTPPLYTVPKSASWWSGGGPGPAGEGAK